MKKKVKNKTSDGDESINPFMPALERKKKPDEGKKDLEDFTWIFGWGI